MPTKFNIGIIGVLTVALFVQSLVLAKTEMPSTFELAIQDALSPRVVDPYSDLPSRPEVKFHVPSMTSGQLFRPSMLPNAEERDHEITNPMMKSKRPVFIENRGQWPEEVSHLIRLEGQDIWLTDGGLIYDFYVVDNNDAYNRADSPLSLKREREERVPPGLDRRGHVVEMNFQGGKAVEVKGENLQPGYHNYFLGNDPSRWASYVPLYGRVLMEELYQGIHARLYVEGGFLRYDLEAKPGADLAEVKLQFRGAEDVRVNSQGELVLETSLGPVTQTKLVAYQVVGNVKRTVTCRFRVNGDQTVGFDVERPYPDVALVIDPLTYATYLGGSGYEEGNVITVDSSGDAYIAGYTGSTDFPATPGAYDTSGGGSYYDAFVAKLNSTGSNLTWATYLGGSGEDNGYGITTDSSGNVYIMGYTGSTDFPATSGAYATSSGGNYDAFVAKLDITQPEVAISSTASLIPDKFALHQNYPNPFNPVTTLRYGLPERTHVVLRIYDILGRPVRTLMMGVQEPGFKTVVWSGTNDVGEAMSTGVYLYQMQAGNFTQTRKMILLK